MSEADGKVWFTVIDEEWRITFPQELVDSLGWKEGTKLLQTVNDGKIFIEAMREDSEAGVSER